MRLYELLARVGSVKKGISPFIEEPPERIPGRFAGWRWSPKEKKWEKVPLEPIKVVMAKQLWPKPTKMPSRTFSSVQPGWSYSFTTYEWVQTVIVATPVEFVPPHLLPPGTMVSEACALAAGQTTLTLMIDKFIAMGVPADQAFDLATRINTVMVRHVVVSPTGEYYKLWDGFSNVMGKEGMTLFQQIGVAVVLATIASALTELLDEIGKRLMWPSEKLVSMEPPRTTYLFGPEEWMYAGLAAVSPTGRPYYSACESIGATNDHHLRGYPGGWDRIAFTPGGFLEKGWKAGRFVRYRWEFWEVKYLGFLTPSGANFYRLQEGSYDKEAPAGAMTVPKDAVCWNFRYYL